VCAEALLGCGLAALGCHESDEPSLWCTRRGLTVCRGCFRLLDMWAINVWVSCAVEDYIHMVLLTARSAAGLSRALLLGAALCLIACGALVARRTDHHFDWDEKDPLESGVSTSIGYVPLGSRVPVAISLTNPSSRSLHICGLQEICSRSGCIRAANLPIEIPAQESGQVRLVFSAPASLSPGPFVLRTALFVDSGRAPRVSLTIQGTLTRSLPSRGTQIGTQGPVDELKPVPPP